MSGFDVDRLRSLLNASQAEVVKWKRIRTPGHGPCCTCQACGLPHDECRCDLDDVADDLAQAEGKVAELQTIVGQLEQTADNVPVIPHRTAVYHPEEIGRDGPAPMYITGSNFACVNRGIGTGTPYYETRTCYSTSDGALAALKRSQPENTEGES